MPLRLEKISKRFDDKWVLRDFSLEVQEGEIFGILGRNGAGKSTVLRIIDGLEEPTSGQIFFHGDITRDPAKTRNFTFLSAENNQSLWKNLFRSRKTDEASQGERQIFEFENMIRAAENVLLLDNPFGCLDPLMHDKAIETLRKTAKEKNLIVVLVTNNQEEVFLACDRACVLHKGEIIQTGTTRELYEFPQSTAVASIFGRNNLITARRITFNNEPIPEFQTLTGDHRLLTGKLPKNALGTITNNVTLMIRPEHISISFGASFPEDNLLKAKIIGIQYCGATTRIQLDANGLILEALVLRLVGLNLDDECLVGLPPDRILVLKE